MIKALKKLFSGTKKVPDIITPGDVYAVTGGKYLGEFFVFIEKRKNMYIFIGLPKLQHREVPHDKFILGVKDKILDKIEKLPTDVFDTCLAQYRKNTDKR